MMFYPIYLVARFMGVESLVLIRRDRCKVDGWHTRFKLVDRRGVACVYPVDLVDRTHHTLLDVEISNLGRLKTKLQKTLQAMYGTAPNFERVSGLVSASLNCGPNFSDVCEFFLAETLSKLGGPVICREEGLGIQRHPDASQWLGDIAAAINGTEYVCASDAMEKYLDPAPLLRVGVSLSPQSFTMVPYRVGVDSSTSILDALMYLDDKQIRSLLSG